MRRRATIAALELPPDPEVGEGLDGELAVSPRPSPPHAEVSSALGAVRGGPFRSGIATRAARHRGPERPSGARAGVRPAPPVDSLWPTREVHRAAQGSACRLGGTLVESAVVRAAPFDCVEIRLDLVWGR